MLEAELEVFFGGGVGGAEVFGEGCEFGGRLIAGDAGFETSGDVDPVEEAGVVVGEVGNQLIHIAESDPELGVEDEIEAAEDGWSDAYDGEGTTGEGDGFAEDGWVSSEAMLPETVAEDDDGGLLFGVEEAAAESHAELGDVKEVGGGGLSPDALRLAGAADGGGDEFKVAGHVGEGAGLVAEVFVEGQGEVVAATVAAFGGVEGHERSGVAYGCGAQDEFADHGEDGGVGSDA